MKVGAPKKILVIRVSRMDGVDPIDEIRSVIEQKGHCWFGKYGRLIGAKAFSDAVSKTIIMVSKDGRAYKPHIFRRSTVQRTVPGDGCFPEYYKDVLRRISFWMKLRPVPEATINLADLQVVSSQMPLTEMLGQAMSGHFICQLRKGATNEAFT